MEQREFFTREVCEVVIEDGIATVSVQTGTMQFNIDMRLCTLLQNMAACDAAVARWQRSQGAQIATLSSRGPMFLRERHD